MSGSSFLIDIRSIQDRLAGQLEVDASVEVPDIIVGSERFIPHGPSHVVVTVTNSGAGIVAAGSVSLEVEAVCSRCLNTFVMSLDGEVEGFFIGHGHEDDLPEEQEYEYIQDGSIDLMPAIESALAVETPFAPLHDEACRGICAMCGANLNEGPCGCPAPESSSPFSVLESLFREAPDPE